MLSYKKTDIIIQLVLMGTITYLFFSETGMNIMIPVILLGMTQLLSVIFHLSADTMYLHTGLRKIYSWLLLLTIIGGVILGTQAGGNGLDELKTIALFTYWTLVLALFYFIICITELIRVTRKKETSG